MAETQQKRAQAQTDLHHPGPQHTHLVLRLGASEREHSQNDRRVSWAEDVIDNEHLGRKSSKCIGHLALLMVGCCIYHKPREWDESSEESSFEDWHGGR